MTKTFTIKDGQAPTQEQLEEVRAAAKREIQFDEDSPELSPAMFKAFRCSVAQRNRKKEERIEILLRIKGAPPRTFRLMY